MGRVRTKTVKKAARLIIERHYPRLTRDFHTNKKICEEVAQIPSKRLRNKIAGYLTHLMKRIEKGPVRGISFKLQEEERERRDNYVPAVSAVDTSRIPIDDSTMEMLQAIGFGDLDSLDVSTITHDTRDRRGRGRGRPGQRRNFNRNNNRGGNRGQGKPSAASSGAAASNVAVPPTSTAATTTPDAAVAAAVAQAQ
eukprot:CAMPEP_0201546828 /NCGR_PEP_ID=MMETSP0173_2-20130828/3184_1 /ASSEMBLY_ACC=CAM_ASM_000268 /TAXON_ID=218659 /ORGANISM="Vexillifera sp., Strain DIVA3 564/2" /LENGTH=195 /DNA_ID=CAMNT_0047955625 /DNA_START=285 /DNA_END=872 /DNA_ORIENTATION=-